MSASLRSLSKCISKVFISCSSAAPFWTSTSAASFSRRSSSILWKLSSSMPSGHSNSMSSSCSPVAAVAAAVPRSEYGSSPGAVPPWRAAARSPTVVPMLPADARLSGLRRFRNSCNRLPMASGSRPELANCCRKLAAEPMSFSTFTRSSCLALLLLTFAENSFKVASASASFARASSSSFVDCIRTSPSSTLCRRASCNRTQ
mmetsp:Transcript_98604/g.250264  ORF Transcript_98604/g.250264 Transcript_98604/m.250264 type:complete len:203 (-) Transcript_98604:474-1082(-)